MFAAVDVDEEHYEAVLGHMIKIYLEVWLVDIISVEAGFKVIRQHDMC